MSEKQSEPKKRGRPAGSRTREVARGETIPSRCPGCGSTERTKYFSRREVRTSGTTAGGHAYNLVVLRRTQCTACGQHRVDRSYENRLAADSGR